MKLYYSMGYYLKKHWRINLPAIFLQILVSGLQVLTNLAMMEMTMGIIQLDLNLFLRWIFIDMGLWLLLCALDMLCDRTKARAKRSMNNTLRANMAAAIAREDYTSRHARQSGEYLSWLSNDVNQIENLAWDTFYNAVYTASQILFSIAALARLHWSLLAVSALVAMILVNAPKLVEKRIQTLSEETAKEQAQAMSKLKDLLLGLDVLRSFGRASLFLEGAHRASDRMEKAKFDLACTRIWVEEAVGVISLLCQCGVNCVIGILSIRGVVIQSALLGGGNLCATIYNGLGTLGQYRVSLLAAKPYFEHITRCETVPPAQPMQEVKQHITIDDLTFRYGEAPVLENTSFRFEKGGKYALTGPSGCGKSTLLKLLLGWLPDYSGTIRFDGRDARAYSPEQLQQQISYIGQNVFLFNTTIRENITLGQEFSQEAMDAALRDSALQEDLAAMPDGLDTIVGEEGSCLSGGQKQRVAIARALIHRRSILLVDEGTSALDQKNADIVEDSLLGNPDLTLILVSHHLSEARKSRFTKVYAL